MRRRRTAGSRERRTCRPRRGRARLRPARRRGAGPPICWTAELSSPPTTGDTAAATLAGREPIAFPRARVIGGCSSHNGCVVAVGCPVDYDGWAAVTGDDRWRAEAIRPALARALERLMVRTYRDDEVGPFHRACLDAAAAIGLPRADDLDVLDGGVGFGIEPVNIDQGVRVNAAFAYLDPARARPNLSILDRALCDRVVSTRAGVDAFVRRDGQELRIAAETVVLCAGAYGSPAILQRSGIGGQADLRSCRDRRCRRPPGRGRQPPRPPDRRARVRRHGTAAAAARRVGGGPIHARGANASASSARAARPGPSTFTSSLSRRTRTACSRAASCWPSQRWNRSRAGRCGSAAHDPDAPLEIDHGYLSDPEGARPRRARRRESNVRARLPRPSRCAR